MSGYWCVAWLPSRECQGPQPRPQLPLGSSALSLFSGQGGSGTPKASGVWLCWLWYPSAPNTMGPPASVFLTFLLSWGWRGTTTKGLSILPGPRTPSPQPSGYILLLVVLDEALGLAVLALQGLVLGLGLP